MLDCIKMRGILRKVCALPCAAGVASVLGWEEVTTPRLCGQPRATAVGCSHLALFISPAFPGIPRLRGLRSE